MSRHRVEVRALQYSTGIVELNRGAQQWVHCITTMIVHCITIIIMHYKILTKILVADKHQMKSWVNIVRNDVIFKYILFCNIKEWIMKYITIK